MKISILHDMQTGNRKSFITFNGVKMDLSKTICLDDDMSDGDALIYIKTQLIKILGGVANETI